MKSVVSEKIDVRYGSVNGIGMFAKTEILPNEIVYIKGGHILTREEMFSSSVINSYLPIDDNWVIGTRNRDEEELIKLYNNHSCNPNCCMRGDIVFIASRKIHAGDELFIDYAFVDNEYYRFKCSCHSPNCRKIVTGFDWQLKYLQQKYSRDCFSSYIQSKISTGISYESLYERNSQITNARNSVFVNELGFDEKDEFEGEETDFVHCCLYQGKDLIAYARVKIEQSTACISRVLVDKNFRNKGYGRQVIFWAETEALKNDIQSIEIHAFDSAAGFYRQLGYTQENDRFIEEGRNHIKMIKNLMLE